MKKKIKKMKFIRLVSVKDTYENNDKVQNSPKTSKISPESQSNPF